MTYYAAHIILAVKLKNRTQTKFPIWENIILIEADNETEAFTKAEAHGRQATGDDDGSFQWQGEPACWEFAGVRKLTECALMGNHPSDGDEISYLEMELESPEAVRKFVEGDATKVTVNELYRTIP